MASKLGRVEPTSRGWSREEQNQQWSEREAVAAEALQQNDKNRRKVWAHATSSSMASKANGGGGDLLRLYRRRRPVLRGGHHLSRARTLPLRRRHHHHRLRVGVSRREDSKKTTTSTLLPVWAFYKLFFLCFICQSQPPCKSCVFLLPLILKEGHCDSCHQGWRRPVWPFGHYYFRSSWIVSRVRHTYTLLMYFLWGPWLNSLF